ncbi:hypothetical protein NW762_011983 [Fusarium torreyae]|uniref:Uncharacterized protein n=1 Tax=Fusarium torreyae TaxID=1237075 RepID=A0A9W8V975_9HYPO|nr:hypothetical protein NW762_011983 [Fusarium torreyae]
MKLLLVFSIWNSLAAASAYRGCKEDTCVKAAIGSYQYPNLDACESFLLTTVVPATTTIHRAKTVRVIPFGLKRATKTVTVLVTATQIKSVVKTDFADLTATEVDKETATVTKVTTVTTTRPVVAPFKRALNQRPKTIKPTNIPAPAKKACTNSAQYSNACSCIGVKPRTTTFKGQTVYLTRTTTIRLPTHKVTKTVATVTKQKTTETVFATETYSTTTVTRVVDTVTVEEDATQTVQATDTLVIDPPLQTIRLFTPDSQDPSLAGGIGYVSLESFRGSTSVYYIKFSLDSTQNVLFGISPNTGEIQAVSGPGSAAGEAVFYSNADVVSYLNVSPDDFATNQGGIRVICKIITDNNNKLVCKWGDNQIAELWTCRERLNFAQPGFDFTSQCADAETSYKINVLRSLSEV